MISKVNLRTSDEYTDELTSLYGYTLDDIMHLTFQVTDRCSLACSYCYQINKGTKRMSFETAKKAVDLLLSDHPDKVGYRKHFPKALIVEFIGGEPLLEIDVVDKITDYIREKTFEIDPVELFNHTRFTIASNGMHYFEPKVKNYLLKNSDLLSFSISLDGNKELHDSCRKFPDGSGSWEKAIAAIRDWRSHGLTMGSKITICHDNLESLYDASRFMVEEGYDEIHINYVFEDVWEADDAKLAYKQLKKFADYLLTLDNPQRIYYSFFSYNNYTPATDLDQNYCGGDGRMIAVDPDGKLFPCIRYMDSSLGGQQKPLCIGDVDNGIGQCASCQKCLNLLDNVTRRTSSNEKCLTCSVANGCAWCSGLNYQLYGTLKKRTTFQCMEHKAAALANHYYINKLNKKFNTSYRNHLYLSKEDALQIIDEDEYNMLIKLEEE